VLNQFLRISWYVSRLPCEDVLIFLEEFDEREFLFGIQIVAYVSNIGGHGLGHDWVCGGGGLGQGLLQLLELYGHH
jgi:hypothetical protein